MTRDFAKKKSTKLLSSHSGARKKSAKSRKPAMSAWSLLLTGAIFGSFVTLLLVLSYLNSKDSPNPADQLAANTTNDNQHNPPLVFEFIEMLKEQTVDVNELPPTAAGKAKKDKRLYFIQVGSFRQYKDADNLRAQLILNKGMDTEIETTTSPQGTTWYRVIVGPFTSRSKYRGAMSILANDNIETLPLTRSAKNT